MATSSIWVHRGKLDECMEFAPYETSVRDLASAQPASGEALQSLPCACIRSICVSPTEVQHLDYREIGRASIPDGYSALEMSGASSHLERKDGGFSGIRLFACTHTCKS